ncbi:hypothetical protein GTP58_16205 [Duganella sp. CY15W]|uniref:hypothetical protein n=1 Tax=Duganella sp. CY15W TaxID=2692172 RepID=UPI00136D34BA|nr:hypothetical protein [Duganella sp. CY15W]MYM29875.1 hypothetical protein [Duganella sp. CY15W]
MSLLTPITQPALSTRARAFLSKDGVRDIGGTPLQQTPFRITRSHVLHRIAGAVALFYPRWVDKAAPGSA